MFLPCNKSSSISLCARTLAPFVRERMNAPSFRPTEVLTELVSEGMSNFIEGQKLLLDLAQREYEIVNTGVKERVGGSAAACGDAQKNNST
jgi:hypothetical protein